MDLELVFLGTSGAVPTVERGTSGLLIIRGGERILVDCGEGTQRQLMRSAGLSRIDRIFLTHLHGDHYLGLPGLMKTLSLQGRSEALSIYGPSGLVRLFSEAQRVFGRQLYPVELTEMEAGDSVEAEGCTIAAGATDHGMPSLAWCLQEPVRPGLFHPERAVALGVPSGPDFRRLQLGETVITPDGSTVAPSDVMDPPRPGRKIVITGDTRPSAAVALLSKRATVLVHDGTFAESESERALATGHSTTSEAAGVAAAADADLLVLTHVSSRHSRYDLLAEARRIFARTLLPSDLDRLVVPYPDKGASRLVRADGTGAGPRGNEPV